MATPFNSLPTARITVLSADDHVLIRAGIAAMLATESDLQLVGEAANGAEALELYLRLRPDVVLMDLRMPVMDGVDATAAIISVFANATIIILTTFDGDDAIRRALDAGATSYVVKDRIRTEIIDAIRDAHRGRDRSSTQL